MIRGFDSPIIPILWYYSDGTECDTKHELSSIRDSDGDIIGLRCEVTGREVHSILREIERLHKTNPSHVYIAESIFSGDNPWDGRTVHGVCLSLEDALDSMAFFAEKDAPLVATPKEEGVWMVHRPDEIARWDGTLWVHKREIWNS